MPPLVTETIRLKEAQQKKLRSINAGRSSFLFRRLLDIFYDSTFPGSDILYLRRQMTLDEEEFKKFKG